MDSALKSFDEQLKSCRGWIRGLRDWKTGPVVTGTVTVETQPTAQTQIPVGTETAKATEGAETQRQRNMLLRQKKVLRYW